MKSSFLNLDLKDVGRGVLIAVLTAVLGSVLPILESGQLPTMEVLRTIGIASVAAGLSYLLKNWLTNSQDKLVQSEPK